MYVYALVDVLFVMGHARCPVFLHRLLHNRPYYAPHVCVRAQFYFVDIIVFNRTCFTRFTLPSEGGGRLFDIHEFRTVFVGFLQVKTSEPCRRDSITLTIQRVTRLRLPCACGALLVVCENYKDKTRHAVSRHGRNYCKVESGGGG